MTDKCIHGIEISSCSTCRFIQELQRGNQWDDEALTFPEDEENSIEFSCPYSLEEKYDMVCSGEYGVFEMYGQAGEVTGYRGFRKGHGTTGIYDSYKRALEAAFTEFGDE